MNLCMFFEGTGQGVAGKITNVTRLRDLCVDDARQKLHLEAGPGIHFGSYLAGKIAGVDWRTTFRSARRWFEANYETLPKDGVSTSVSLFGFSCGALLARHFAAWLDKFGVAVAYLGLWDTVDANVGLDVSADCPRERELREFTAAWLAPGETKTVTFALPPEAFALYDADLKRVVELGDFTVFVGPDSTTANAVRITLKTR